MQRLFAPVLNKRRGKFVQRPRGPMAHPLVHPISSLSRPCSQLQSRPQIWPSKLKFQPLSRMVTIYQNSLCRLVKAHIQPSPSGGVPTALHQGDTVPRAVRKFDLHIPKYPEARLGALCVMFISWIGVNPLLNVRLNTQPPNPCIKALPQILNLCFDARHCQFRAPRDFGNRRLKLCIADGFGQ